MLNIPWENNVLFLQVRCSSLPEAFSAYRAYGIQASCRTALCADLSNYNGNKCLLFFEIIIIIVAYSKGIMHGIK